MRPVSCRCTSIATRCRGWLHAAIRDFAEVVDYLTAVTREAGLNGRYVVRGDQRHRGTGMKRTGFLPLEWIVVLYFLSYLPNILLTKLATSRVHPELGRPLTGLETLPSTLIVNMLLTLLFIWLSGWHRDAHGMQFGGVRLPVPTRYTVLSGVGTALVLFTVPLSFTFTDVSIPFIQLLMRGDILLIAPLVDLIFRPPRALVELDGAGDRGGRR